MKLVGLTGGIGSGKTTVAKIFEALSIAVFYSDQEAKDLIATDPFVKSAIITLLGNRAYDNGEYNRTYVASIVFKDQKKLIALNEIVHPVVRKKFNNWCDQHSDSSYVINEAALFYENGQYKLFDKIISVSAPKELRIKRVMSRDNITHEKVEARIKNQLSQEVKDSLSDFVIHNSGERLLIPQVLKIHKILSK